MRGHQFHLARRAEEAQPGSTLFLVSVESHLAHRLTAQAYKKNWRVHHADPLSSAPPDSAPSLIITELDVINEQAFERVAKLRALFFTSNIAVVTAVASVALAVASMKAGATTVLTLPVRFDDIVENLAQSHGTTYSHISDSGSAFMSLDRAIWEYISQVMVASGTISEAARRLRLDRTSLKRMLRKSPPSW